MSEGIEQVTDESFEQAVVKSDVPVLVDFWAPWCGPCRVIGPVLEEIASEYAGKAKIAKVNVDEQQKIAGTLGIRSIPTLCLYKNGEIKETVVGVQPKETLTKLIDGAL